MTATIQRQAQALHHASFNAEDQFSIDMEAIAEDGRPMWEWLGYSTKSNAVRSLGKLEEGTDYLLLKSDQQVQSADGTWQKRTVNRVMLSADGFKQWCMLAPTETGREVRRYFIEAEKKSRERSPQWLLKRSKGKEMRKQLTEELTKRDVSGVGIARCTNAGYRAMWGKTAKQKREELGITAKTNLRDNLPVSDLIAITAHEAVLETQVRLNDQTGDMFHVSLAHNTAAAVQRLLTTPIENQHDDRVPQSPRKAYVAGADGQLELLS